MGLLLKTLVSSRESIPYRLSGCTVSPGAIWVREIARGVKAMGPLEMDHSVWTPVASQVVNALPCLQKGEAVWCSPPGTIHLVLPLSPHRVLPRDDSAGGGQR